MPVLNKSTHNYYKWIFCKGHFIAIFTQLLYVFLLFTLALPVHAQTRAIDSMRTLLQTQQSDTDRVKTLNYIGHAIHTSKPEQTELYAREALALAQKVGYRRGLAEAYRIVGLSLWARARPIEALEALTTSLNIFREIGNKSGMGDVYNNIALVYYLQGNYAQAQIFYFQALTKAEESGDEFGKTIALSNIGELYERQNNLSKANELYQKALPLAKQFNRFMLSRVLLNLGSVTYKLGKPSEALAFLQQAVVAAEEANDKQDLTLVLRTIGIIERSNDPAKALSTLFRALAIAEAIPDNSSISLNCVALSETYLVMGNTTQALAFARRALGTARKFDLKLEIKLSAEALTSAYEDVGDSKNALAAYKMAMAYKDSLFNDESAQRIAGVEYDYKLEKQKAEAQALRNEQVIQRMILVGVVAALILMAGLLVLALYSNAQRKRANATLTSQKAVIEKQSEQIQLTNTKLQEYNLELDISLQNLTTLSAIGRSITATLDVDTILMTMYEQVRTLMDAAVFEIGIYDAERNMITFELGIQDDVQLGHYERTMTDKNQFAVYCIEYGEEIIMNDIRTEFHRYIQAPQKFIPVQSELMTDEEMQSAIYIPLVVQDRVLGVIAVQSRQKNHFTLSHRELLRSIASYAATALDNATAYEYISHQQELLEEQAREIELANNELRITNETLEEKNDELVELNNEKNEFLGIAAHDLQNPLGNIRLAAEMLLRYNDRMTTEKQHEMLAQIISIADRAFHIVKTILDVNAIERGQLPMVLQPTDLTRAAINEVALLMPQAHKKNITIQYHASDAVSAIADEALLQQILNNLLSNAVKYSPQGTTIVVRVLASATTARVEVQDEGPGLSEEDKAKLFGKFARLSARPTGGEHSTGLGLSIVKKMVEAMQGRVWCESELSKGATFIVELPAVV